MLADKEYVEWLADLKQRFQRSQAKAAIRVNATMLGYYWSLGRDITQKQAESKWGSGFFNQLSLDMRAMFPNEKGFSSANLRYMKRWYEFYYQKLVNLHQAGEEIRQQPADELPKQVLAIRQQVGDEISHQVGDQLKGEKSHQVGGQLDLAKKGELELRKKRTEGMK